MPKIFCENEYLTFTVENSTLKFWATSVIFKKLLKVNNHPIGENSPNLVTLLAKELAIFSSAS
jgi:hypothetical protein